jgi:addiction module RelE/StbE family toxin
MSLELFEVDWAEVAIRDLERIVDFVEQEAPLAAQRLFDEIAERARTLESLPLRGRLVPELARFEITTYRDLIIAPYRLMYRVDARRVLVVGVFDGRRNLEDVLLSRLTLP